MSLLHIIELEIVSTPCAHAIVWGTVSILRVPFIVLEKVSTPSQIIVLGIYLLPVPIIVLGIYLLPVPIIVLEIVATPWYYY